MQRWISHPISALQLLRGAILHEMLSGSNLDKLLNFLESMESVKIN